MYYTATPNRCHQASHFIPNAPALTMRWRFINLNNIIKASLLLLSTKCANAAR